MKKKKHKQIKSVCGGKETEPSERRKRMEEGTKHGKRKKGRGDARGRLLIYQPSAAGQRAFLGRVYVYGNGDRAFARTTACTLFYIARRSKAILTRFYTIIIYGDFQNFFPLNLLSNLDSLTFRGNPPRRL